MNFRIFLKVILKTVSSNLALFSLFLLFAASASQAGSHILLTEEGTTFQDTGHELVEVLLNKELLKARAKNSDLISDVKIDEKDPNVVWVLIQNSSGVYPAPKGPTWARIRVLQPKEFAESMKIGKFLFVVILPYPRMVWHPSGHGERLPESRFTMEASPEGATRWIPRGKFQLQIFDFEGNYLGDPSYAPYLFSSLSYRCGTHLSP